jgi:hypothetical protein
MNIDRRKALRIRTEGESAQDQLSEITSAYLAARLDVAAKRDEIRYHVGDVPLRDLLRWDDETLHANGLRREKVLRAIEAAEDLEDSRRRMETRRAVLEPKARLAARMNEWLRAKGIAL